MIQLLNALLSIIFSVLEFIVTGIFNLVVECFPSKNTGGYQASFMSPNKLLNHTQSGFAYGDRNISIEQSYMNSVVLGNTGSGKSVCTLIPSILTMLGESSLAVHDPSNELKTATFKVALLKKYRVLTLNYAKPNESEFYNPLERVKTISDIKKLAKMLVCTSLGTGGKDPFWNESAMNLISLFIRYVLFYTEKENRNLYNVLCLLNAFSSSPQTVDALFVKTNDSDLLALYKAFVAYDSKMLMSILATARQSLEIFGDPDIAIITSKDTIDFIRFKAEKTILYITNSVNSMKYYSTISSIFFEQFYASVMEEIPTKDALPIFFLLDEASSLYMSMLSIVISNIRKYKAGLMLVFQTQSQLLDMYGVAQARNILSNCFTKCFLPGQPLEVCRELESILGKVEIIDEQNVKKVRPLLTMDEIRLLSETIILCGNHAPIKMKLTPYYEQKNLQKLIKEADLYYQSMKQSEIHDGVNNEFTSVLG